MAKKEGEQKKQVEEQEEKDLMPFLSGLFWYQPGRVMKCPIASVTSYSSLVNLRVDKC